MSILRIIAKPKMNMLTAHTCLCLPFSIALRPRDTLISGSVSFVHSAISLIICTSTWAKIRSAIVETVTINVVNLWEFARRKLAMHEDYCAAFKSCSVVQLRFSNAVCVPIPLHKPFVIGSVNDNKFSTSEGNVSGGRIRGLFDL